ncbi:MAG: uridine kinase, partial [Oscillospiraceae bacterium]
MNQEILTIGICGGTGSGKTTLTNELKRRFPDDISVVNQDSYYRRNDEMSLEERAKLNYDHPDAIEMDLMVDQIRSLKEGKAIDCPVYDFSVNNRTDRTVRIEPTGVIIVEGILIFTSKELRDLLDIKVYVDADADVRILRRLTRDIRERGRTIESVIHQYLTTVKPMHEQFVEPSKKYA